MKQRVQASMDALGYRPHRPARGMRGRTFTLGLLVSDIENPFFSLIADGITSVVRSQGYELLISPGGYDAGSQNAVIDALIDHQMDALVLIGPVVTGADLERIAGEIPLVVVGRHSRSAALDSVSGDDELGSALVVDHLVALGHRRIAFVANQQDSLEPDRPESVRLAGFVEAMARHGLAESAMVVDSRWSLTGGHEAARVIAETAEAVTAVFAGADVTAFGIMSELWERGLRVPDAYSLAGYDNSRMTSIGPIDLTTVDQSGFEMGETAGRLALERIGGRTESRHVLLRPRLILRSTTRSVAAGG
ncbi:LacI family transcriptional regulator [Schumannella luteola]|nr:LacI family transcriptional regulator [Schumannella luteola]